MNSCSACKQWTMRGGEKKKEKKGGGCLAWGSWSWWGGSIGGSEGFSGGNGGWWRLWEEEAETCRGEGKHVVATVVVFVIGPRWCWGEKLVYWWLSLANVRGGGSGRDREKQRENCRLGKEKPRDADFLPTLDSIFSSPRSWNPSIFIVGGRWIFYLYWCQILALYSTRKYPNRWLKVAIIGCHICCRKMANRIGHFGVVSRSLWCQSTKIDHTRV